MKIRAAVLNRMGAPTPYAESKPLSITEVDLDPPGPGEVLVKIAAAGLCHSDLSVIDANRPRPMPMVLGHEAAGVVEELGPGVDDLAIGDHVVMVFVPSCGHCVPCAEGRPALCEPGAVANTARVQAGPSVAVIGLGGVGLAALLGAVAAGARSVLAVDLSDDKLGLARQLGATETFNAGAPDAVEAIRAATNGGVECAFEMAGSVRAMEFAYKITRRGGMTVTAGLPPPTHTFNIPQVNLVAEERTVKGSYIGTCVPTRDIPRYIELYRRGKLPVDRLMSSHLTLDDINLGFDLLHEGRAVRQIVTM